MFNCNYTSYAKSHSCKIINATSHFITQPFPINSNFSNSLFRRMESILLVLQSWMQRFPYRDYRPNLHQRILLNGNVLLSEGTSCLPSKHNPLKSFPVRGGFSRLSPNPFLPVEFCSIEKLMVMEIYRVIACMLELKCNEDVMRNVWSLPKMEAVLLVCKIVSVLFLQVVHYGFQWQNYQWMKKSFKACWH